MNEDHPNATGGDDAAGNGHAGESGETPPHLDESVRRIGAAGRNTLDSALDTGRALRKLVSADFALARSALGRALAWSAVAIVFGASAWLLAMGAMIALLQAAGLSWLASISLACVLSLLVTGVAIWRVSVFFDHAGMHATRRQLSRLGLFQESDPQESDPQESAPQEGAEAAESAGGPKAPAA